ncbi:MAG: hypothetical protein KAJ47_00235 [Candidatus Aenigmarchaeota archaeon]|nr:hypothetical protein [Candidatus Aenigmarchaeota archaeon]
MPRINIHKSELYDKRILLKNSSSFLHKHLESSKPTEWDGFWIPPLKYIEDIRFKVNGAQLCDKHIQEIDVYPTHTEMNYPITKNISIKQIFIIPDKKIPSFASILEITNDSDKLQHIKIELEVDANIKGITEYTSSNIYSSDFSVVRSSVTVTSTGKNDSITYSALEPLNEKKENINQSVKFRPLNTYKKQQNIDGTQYTVYSPGTYTVTIELKRSSTIKLPFIFIAGRKKDDNLNTLDILRLKFNKIYQKKTNIDKKFSKEYSHINELQGIKTPINSINRTFIWSATQLKDFHGLTNLPEKNYYDIWNLLWSTIGLIDIGDTDHATHMLKVISDLYSKDHKSLPTRGQINHHINYNSKDINPLFIITADYLNQFSGKKEDNFNKIKKKLAKSISIKDNQISSGFSESWLQIKENDHSMLEQSLWSKAFETIDIYKSNKIRQYLLNYWKHDKRYMKEYSKDEELHTINMIIPVLFNQLDKKIQSDILKTIKTSYTSAYGISTMSHFHPKYYPSNKGKGAVSLLATAWSATAYLRNNMIDEAKNLLNILSQDIETGTVGHFSEFRKPTDKKTHGLSTSVETSAMFIHTIDYGLFGIQPDMTKKTILIEPTLISWDSYERFGKIIGNNSMRLSIRKEKYKNKNIRSITIEFKKRPDVKIHLKLPEKFNILYKEKETKSDNISFDAEIHNKIILK